MPLISYCTVLNRILLVTSIILHYWSFRNVFSISFSFYLLNFKYLSKVYVFMIYFTVEKPFQFQPIFYSLIDDRMFLRILKSLIWKIALIPFQVVGTFWNLWTIKLIILDSIAHLFNCKLLLLLQIFPCCSKIMKCFYTLLKFIYFINISFYF